MTLQTTQAFVKDVKGEEINQPSIWIACLSAYNSGYLHGAWIVPKTTVEELEEQIREVLKTSPVGDPEEWAVHDYNNFHNLGEYPGLENICKLAKAYEEHGLKKVNGFLENWSVEDLEHLEDAFYGEYSDFSEFAQELAETCIEGLNGNSTLARYFDYEAWERDLSYDYHESAGNGSNIFVWNGTWQGVNMFKDCKLFKSNNFKSWVMTNYGNIRIKKDNPATNWFKYIRLNQIAGTEGTGYLVKTYQRGLGIKGAQVCEPKQVILNPEIIADSSKPAWIQKVK